MRHLRLALVLAAVVAVAAGCAGGAGARSLAPDPAIHRPAVAPEFPMPDPARSRAEAKAAKTLSDNATKTSNAEKNP